VKVLTLLWGRTLRQFPLLPIHQTEGVEGSVEGREVELCHFF